MSVLWGLYRGWSAAPRDLSSGFRKGQANVSFWEEHQQSASTWRPTNG